MKFQKVILDLNNEVFQEQFFSLNKPDKLRVIDTLTKLNQMGWRQVYVDRGLKWEKIHSVKPPKGIDSIYSLRITGVRRATVIRGGDTLRFLTIQPDHDSTYGRK